MRGFPAGVGGGADVDRTGYLRPVAVAVTAGNVDLSSLPATVDGETLAAGAVFWVNDQTDATEVGPWVYTGEGLAATRPEFWATGYIHQGDQLKVLAGSVAGVVLTVDNADPITIGTTEVTVTPSVPVTSVTSSDGNNIVATTVDGGCTLTIGTAVWRNANMITPAYFAGRNGAGTITVTGVAINDVIMMVIPSYGAFPAGDPSFTVSGTNTITQGSALDLSATTFRIVLKRNS